MNERLTRNEQREAARAKARALREQAKKGEKRKRLIIQSSVVVGTLAIVGTVAWAIINGANTASVSGLTPKNFIFDDGIKLGVNAAAYTSESTPTPSATPGAKAPINIKMYIDYQCPVCKNFEAGNIDQIKSWLNSGYATLEVHPISFLDGKGSPNYYSSRAANAAICVAENSPNQFFAFNKALFENQPEEGTSGPENDELFKTAQSVGVMNSSKIKSCIDAKSYGDWISKTTSSVLDPKYVVPGSKVQVGGTPTIVVNGQQYQFSTMDELTNAARFAQFVQKAAGN